MEKRKIKESTFGLSGTDFSGLCCFLIVAAVGVIAAVQIYAKPGEGRIWMLCTRRAASDRVALYLKTMKRQEEERGSTWMGRHNLPAAWVGAKLK